MEARETPKRSGLALAKLSRPSPLTPVFKENRQVSKSKGANLQSINSTPDSSSLSRSLNLLKRIRSLSPGSKTEAVLTPSQAAFQSKLRALLLRKPKPASPPLGEFAHGSTRETIKKAGSGGPSGGLNGGLKGGLSGGLSGGLKGGLKGGLGPKPKSLSPSAKARVFAVPGAASRRGGAALRQGLSLILRIRARLAQGLDLSEQVREFLDQSRAAVSIEALFRDPRGPEGRAVALPAKLGLFLVLFVLNASQVASQRARALRALEALVELYRAGLSLLLARSEDPETRALAEEALSELSLAAEGAPGAFPARAAPREARLRLVEAVFALYGSHALCARLEREALEAEALPLADSHNRCFALFEAVLSGSEPDLDPEPEAEPDPAFVVQPLKFAKFLPPKRPSAPPLTLVLDLDETLIHFEETSAGGEFLVRPGATEFIEAMAGCFEVVVFTAAVKDYADWILDRLDPARRVAHRLYRQHTQPVAGVYLKDLSRLGRELSQTVIVDNNAENFALQPDNGILIKTWHDDPRDSALAQLAGLLARIAAENPRDIREALEQVHTKLSRKKN